MNYTEKCKWLADFYRNAAETGRQMQRISADGKWITSPEGPDTNSTSSQWRLKPEPKKAWVVWDDSGVRGVFNDYDEAGKHCEIINGVFHEITRPD